MNSMSLPAQLTTARETEPPSSDKKNHEETLRFTCISSAFVEEHVYSEAPRKAVQPNST